MTLFSKSLWCVLASCVVAIADQSDIINFENDNTLHGKFISFTNSGKVIWANPSFEKNVTFNSTSVRKIALNKGKKTKPFKLSNCYVRLKNSDIIPGKVLSLSGEKLTLETDFGGEITILKDKIIGIGYKPISDTVIYRGPFSKDEPWIVRFPGDPYGDLSQKELVSKNSWYIKNQRLNHQGRPSSILMDIDLPDKYRICFNTHSDRTNFPRLTLMADLKVPKIDEKNEKLKKSRFESSNIMALHQGTSIFISMKYGLINLFLYDFKENGELRRIRVTNTKSLPRALFRENEFKSFYDLRVDKKAGLIMLYKNKHNIAKWKIPTLSEKFKGSHFGFNIVNGYANSTTSISDIIITPWNGLDDPTPQIKSEPQDVVILNNRSKYSGEITSITSSTVEMKSNYSNFSIPHDQVDSVSFAKKKLQKPEALEKQHIVVHFYDKGKITGLPSRSADGSFSLESKALGKIKIKSEFVSLLQFREMRHSGE